jgi:DNA mismatch endonuclease, patch repair protein
VARIHEESRSKIMSAIKRRDTKSEILVRKELWKRGLRGYRVDVKLPGRPDILFPRYKLCIFVDGCFWHGCPIHFKGVASNVGYWMPKIQRNRQRDVQASDTLVRAGFVVRRFWDHEIVDDGGLRVVDEIEALIHSMR